MSTLAGSFGHEAVHPVDVRVEPTLDHRNRLTTAFRVLLALPHLVLVGGPMAATLWWSTRAGPDERYESSSGGGVLGVAATVVAIIAWFAIVFTGRCPDGLWKFAAYYLRWRVRAVAYVALLRDEYPPFGDGPYPATLELGAPPVVRDRLSVAFRIILVIPHLVALWALGIAWAVTGIAAWFAILFTGRFPAALYRFDVGVFRWSTRVEAYMLLLHDAYPPFSLTQG